MTRHRDKWELMITMFCSADEVEKELVGALVDDEMSASADDRERTSVGEVTATGTSISESGDGRVDDPGEMSRKRIYRKG